MGLLPYPAKLQEEAWVAERKLRDGGWHEVADLVEAMAGRMKEQGKVIGQLLGMKAQIEEVLGEVRDIDEAEYED